ncbi:methyltransferase family protein [Vibrio sp. LaRot3]|uniref:methyltransferase family protein n=1 Tax=Vibrio sp. LaRot3 TaxID=2998829 RepID=UPI0022CDFB46|nr:isoprenylcysteine carboxylmethyltransferase family protein [Vibrio sp. LaRot3]MDA0147470.1 isoprenylcysteine carboxylmethyltransferase family protein [Vibrio sp. LaRot3]
MTFLERKIPPVALFLILALAMVKLDHMLMGFEVSLPLPMVIFALVVVIATVIGLAGVFEFRKAKTTVNPVKVEQASSVVDSGIFSYTRNPMYLGLVMVLFGLAYWQQNIVCFVMPLVFIFYMNKFQIEPEERALEMLFGAEYLDYKQRVRRWI